MAIEENVNKKILWLCDFDLDRSPGGAQLSDLAIITKGKLLGFNILKLTNETYNSSYDVNNYDILITSNIHSLTHRNPDLLNKISNHKHHVRLEHDSNHYLSQEDRIKLFSSCKKTFFLSDFHYAFFKHFYGDIFKNVEINYDPIDTSKFFDKKCERENKILYSGYMHLLKGSLTFFEYALKNPNLQFVVAGWTDNVCLLHLAKTINNIEFLGHCEHENMPEIYNKYKVMYYEPNLNEPFCRSVAEAMLCGMSIMTSKQNNIGCINEIAKVGKDKFREECEKAAFNFWQKI